MPQVGQTLLDENCPTLMDVRVGYSVLENGTKVRVCKKCGASIEE